MTDAILVNASGVIIQVNRDAVAADQPKTKAGDWCDALSGVAVAGLIRAPDGSFSAPPRGSDPVPASVTNFQARAVMRQTFLPDGRSLFTAVNEDLGAARTATSGAADNDPAKIAAEIRWQAWEQANDYLRNGPLVMSLASIYGFSEAATDELFRQASQVIA